MNLASPLFTLEKFQRRSIKEIKGLLWAFVVVMIVRTFLYQPFNIPSGSMIPTLLVGDFLIANKYIYGYSNQTFPFRFNIMDGRVLEKIPSQGEVVIFHNPKHDGGLDYVKRLIGLPGDRIQVKKGILHVNGVPLKLEKDGTYQYVDLKGRLQVLDRYMETLPSGVKHVILRDHGQDEADHNNTIEFVVPKGHFFMMGDNRDNSMDSREQKMVGFIPFKNVMGRAELLFFSTEAKWYEPWKWLFSVRYERVMTFIR